MIRGHCEGLRSHSIPHLILSSSKSSDEMRFPTSTVPELDYSTKSSPGLAEQIKASATEEFGTADVIWHFHNPCLGKNPGLTEAVNQLGSEGHRVILQHHDFAEDGRQKNFQRLRDLDEVFPFAPHIHHVCINHRDLSFLIRAGLPAEQCSVLKNPISFSSRRGTVPSWVFQPVRGIRRKNLGETLLLAAHSPTGTRFAISRRPEQDHSTGIHDTWKDLASELSVPVEFAVTDRLQPAPDANSSFDDWLGHASHILSTSIAEGFGMPFLEASNLGIPLLGRRLRELDPDLSALPLSSLYDEVLVPVGDACALSRRRVQAVNDQHHAYGIPLPDTKPEPIPPMVDFGALPEDIQEAIIRQSIADDLGLSVSMSGHTLPLSQYLSQTLAKPIGAPADLGSFHPNQICQELVSIRHKLEIAEPLPPAQLDRARLAAEFLSPERFRFLQR